MKFSGVTFVVHLFHPRSKIRGVPRFARARGSWLWSVTSSSWILSGSNRTRPQFVGAVEMCWEEAPGRQTPPRGRPRLQGLACSSLTGRDGCATYNQRVGGQGGGLLTVNARGLQLFNVRAQSPVPRGDSNGRGCPLPRRCVVTRGRCHQGAEVKTKSGSDFCRHLQWWCLSTCGKQKALSHSVVSTCPWTGQPGSRVQWGR